MEQVQEEEVVEQDLEVVPRLRSWLSCRRRRGWVVGLEWVADHLDSRE
jgi:hypothetical protein